MAQRLSSEDHRRNARSIEQFDAALAEILPKLRKCSSDHSVHAQHIELVTSTPVAKSRFDRLFHLFRKEVPQLPPTDRVTVWLICDGILEGVKRYLYLEPVTGEMYLGSNGMTPVPFASEDLAIYESEEVSAFVTEVREQGEVVVRNASANKLP